MNQHKNAKQLRYFLPTLYSKNIYCCLNDLFLLFQLRGNLELRPQDHWFANVNLSQLYRNKVKLNQKSIKCKVSLFGFKLENGFVTKHNLMMVQKYSYTTAPIR